MKPVIVNEEKCVGCSLCVRDCPGGYLYLENGKAHTHDAGCIECGHCYAICPQGAVKLTNYDCEEEPAGGHAQQADDPSVYTAAG